MKKLTISRINDQQTFADIAAQIMVNPIMKETPQGLQPEQISTADAVKFYMIAKQFEEFQMPDVGNGTMLLEDSEYEVLKNRVDAWRWPAVTKSIVDFIESVNSAENVSKKELASSEPKEANG